MSIHSFVFQKERMINMGHHKKEKKTGVFGKILASGLLLAGAKKVFDNKDQILDLLKEEEKSENKSTEDK